MLDRMCLLSIPLFIFLFCSTTDKGNDFKDTDSVASREIPPPSQPSRAPSFTVSILKQGPKEQLLQAREILELGLKNVSQARQAVALTDGKSIADIGWVKVSTTPSQLKWS